MFLGPVIFRACSMSPENCDIVLLTSSRWEYSTWKCVIVPRYKVFVMLSIVSGNDVLVQFNTVPRWNVLVMLKTVPLQRFCWAFCGGNMVWDGEHNSLRCLVIAALSHFLTPNLTTVFKFQQWLNIPGYCVLHLKPCFFFLSIWNHLFETSLDLL